MNRRISVSLHVNAKTTEFEVTEDEMLLTTLRERASERGVRTACGVGECGSCTVLVSGVAAATCVTPTTSVDGTKVTTPSSTDLDAVRRAFLDLQAAQRGYCINGIMMRVHELASRGPTPTVTELTEALDQHLCRCGTTHGSCRQHVRPSDSRRPRMTTHPPTRPPSCPSWPDSVVAASSVMSSWAPGPSSGCRVNLRRR